MTLHDIWFTCWTSGEDRAVWLSIPRKEGDDGMGTLLKGKLYGLRTFTGNFH